MILRRFTQHLKDQNWFAVGLDVIVVIVGIFLGMQVTEWNDKQKLRSEEVYFLQRLKQEVSENIERVSTGIEMRGSRLDNLRSDLDYLSGKPVKWTEDQAWCNGILSSHIYINFSSPIPALQELTATGKLYSLSNANLRQELASHIALTDYMQGAVSRLFDKSTSMSESFPALIQARLLNDESGEQIERVTYQCDVELMGANPGFINTITSNHSRYNTYISLQEEYLERLKSINMLLDTILGELGS